MSCKAKGFTLIEVMVALLLMTILSILSWRALDAMSRTRDTLNAHGQREDQLKALFNLWDKDCRQLGFQGNWTISLPVHWDESQIVLIKEQTFANGVSRPIVVIYEAQNQQLVRIESKALNTRQELMRVWSNALNHHLTPDLGLMNKEVLLDSIDSISTSIFVERRGWINNEKELIPSSDSNTPRGLSLKALKLSVTLTHQVTPIQKIALTGVE
ncbi:MAG: prepilin-type N-terminal cleavage/methylation domain-containing protein [Betaproteobacteria bacterium]|nr:prepilin-type N-terminal cleavage/methylation domain-containing protein [Betaproteobacteria bacterium]